MAKRIIPNNRNSTNRLNPLPHIAKIYQRPAIINEKNFYKQIIPKLKPRPGKIILTKLPPLTATKVTRALFRAGTKRGVAVRTVFELLVKKGERPTDAWGQAKQIVESVYGSSK